MLKRFQEIVTRHTGLVVPAGEGERCARILAVRQKQLALPSVESYLQLLDSELPEAHREWRELAWQLTVGESYFFRDSGQMALLQNQILPRLIQRHRATRTLRIWSAGCSTGEEPFSLAMLLDRLLPDLEDWELLLLGSDINDRSLERARSGLFGPWSFRRVPDELKERYFQPAGSEWRLERRILELVTFRHLNLIKTPFPDPGNDLWRMDLILCRNVFIYFPPEVVEGLVERFGESLAPGGYLMTGHAELVHRRPSRLKAVVHPESVVYVRQEGETESPGGEGVGSGVRTTGGGREARGGARSTGAATGSASGWRGRKEGGAGRLPVGGGGDRSGAPVRAVAPFSGPGAGVPKPRPTPVSPAPRLPGSPGGAGDVEGVRELLVKGEYAAALQLGEGLLARAGGAPSGDLLYLLARIQANLGRLDQAVRLCREAARRDPALAAPHYLLAHVAMESGATGEAKEHLRRAIYLDPAHVPAFLELAEIHRREGDGKRARKMLESALSALGKVAPGVRLDGWESHTAAELMEQLRGRLAESG